MQLNEQLARTFAAMGRLMNALGGGLPRPDFMVLVQLDQGAEEGQGVRSSDLARSQGLDPSTMSRRLTSLGERGLIVRETDPADARASLNALSEAGREALRAERARRVSLVTDALAEWSEQDRTDLARLLSQLTDSLDQIRAERRTS